MTAGRQAVSSKKDWCTPKKLIVAVKQVFGGQIDLDPCSNEFSIVGANTEFMLTHQDGLQQSWNYKTIYVNPPYGSDTERGTTIKNWYCKIAEAYIKHGAEIIVLVPVAPNTAHWKKYVFPIASAICFLYDTRLKFLIKGSENNKGAPMACCCIYYGERQSVFADVFSEFGAVVPLDHIQVPPF
jgi:hypothetical protein